MFKHLIKDASERNRSVIRCQRFIALFQGGHDIGLQLICRELASPEGSITDDFVEVISSWISLSRRGLSLSGPAALLGFRFSSSFNSQFWEMLISDMVAAESCNVSGVVSECRPPALFKSLHAFWRGERAIGF